MAKLDRAFYDRNAVEVARDLLGKVLVRSMGDDRLSGRIVETEAYTGAHDPGSHAYRRATDRNRVMFGRAGFLYVYLSYGMHYCMNVVTDPSGIAGAVLIRALEPLDGLPVMEQNRCGKSIHQLLNGPGKLCQALAITRQQNGVDLEGSEIWVEDDRWQPRSITVTSRVGLTAGTDLPYRFLVSDSQWISPGRPSGVLPLPLSQD